PKNRYRRAIGVAICAQGGRRVAPSNPRQSHGGVSPGHELHGRRHIKERLRMDLASLLQALAQPAAYRHPVGTHVEIRQTHISVVFLAGAYVYKVKKPIKLAFLDFSTLEKRLDFCRQEVRLNRRLAPEVYLGVAPVVRTTTGIQIEGEGEVVEWAVKMQRLPDDATLQERLRREQVGLEL